MQNGAFPIEFVGGSQDGEVVHGMAAPDFYDLIVAEGVREIYKRQSKEQPFIYVQVGYGLKENQK